MDFSAYANCEVWGVSLQAYVHAFRQYPTVLEKYFKRYGLGENLDPEVLKAQWVPMDVWLRITHEIVDEVGASTVYSVGRKIPEMAIVPPEVDSTAAVIRAVDIAYHLHHRKDGVIMFDLATGVMLEGIGHYRCEIDESGTAATLICDNPYACDLDRGILTGFAARFEPAVSVSHATTACRKKGDPACHYLVQW